jgi:hypothetical protein
MLPAQINSGNSGGPAFNSSGQCIGIAFQSLKHEDAENIGYIIPEPVIAHFINDYERNGEGFKCYERFMCWVLQGFSDVIVSSRSPLSRTSSAQR